MRRLIMAILALVVFAGAPAGSLASAVGVARADGDPASDVLLGRGAFIPSELSLTAAPARLLTQELAAAARDGFPLRVAIIAEQGDLGSVTALWQHPGGYAEYLHRELVDAEPGQVLVVMPAGYGLAPSSGAGAVSSAERHVFAPTPTSGEQLVNAAAVAVDHLARAAGHPLPASALTVTGTVAPGPAASPLPWVAFAAGLLVVAAAWGVSLRVRPPTWRAARASR